MQWLQLSDQLKVCQKAIILLRNFIRLSSIIHKEGAVDSLSSILALRKQLQAEGLSFLVHADAAWGGYFCSMLPKNYHPGDVINLPTEMGEADGFVPDAPLKAQTQVSVFWTINNQLDFVFI